MPEQSDCSPRERLVKLAQQILKKNLIVRPISIHDQLAKAGLSSIDVVELMLAVEAEFDIVIPQSEITPSNFRSLMTIEDLMMRIGSRAPKKRAP